MSNRRERDPAQIVESLQVKSTVYKEASTKLSERVHRFESWLNTLPAKVETYHSFEHPDGPPLKVVLRFHRVGRAWRISWDVYNEDFEADASWDPLTEAPVVIKQAAIAAFPALLEDMEESQERWTKKLLKTCEDYDQFESTLPVLKKEGK